MKKNTPMKTAAELERERDVESLKVKLKRLFVLAVAPTPQPCDGCLEVKPNVGPFEDGRNLCGACKARVVVGDTERRETLRRDDTPSPSTKKPARAACACPTCPWVEYMNNACAHPATPDARALTWPGRPTSHFPATTPYWCPLTASALEPKP